jgi:hypothetical protein
VRIHRRAVLREASAIGNGGVVVGRVERFVVPDYAAGPLSTQPGVPASKAAPPSPLPPPFPFPSSLFLLHFHLNLMTGAYAHSNIPSTASFPP